MVYGSRTRRMNDLREEIGKNRKKQDDVGRSLLLLPLNGQHHYVDDSVVRRLSRAGKLDADGGGPGHLMWMEASQVT